MSDTLSCASAREWVHRQLDDELAAADVPRLAAHVANCAQCARHAAELREVSALIGEVADSPRPVVPDLPVSLDDAPGTVLDAPVRARTPVWSRLTGGIAAAALIAVCLVFLDGPPGHEAPPADTRSVATLEIGRASLGSAVAISLPSQHRSVHVFWVYETEKGNH